MGVTGLWTVVAPTARPTQLATLNRKRLAVDASIWIYQFLKAVRDKEGNALRNSHVVGFFRRICKLLYFGIKPVFVFDGGAPVLKRETVRARARRREGRREDAARTAGKLLAVQVARAAEEEEKRRRAERDRTPDEDELPPDQELVYVDEIGMDQKERQAGRSFKRKDQYHLPDLDVSIESMGAPNDPRIMSQVELEEYARQFHSGEDINLYDFSKIDFESPFFLSLPPGDRYNILNAARLRSRLRMGYSKDQLDGMFPDRMAFSRFQIERVKERNELTQRLMHLNGMSEDFLNQGGRIAGEKGKEYVLVKNDGVEGGWALGVVSNKAGTLDQAIDVDREENSESSGDEVEDEDDFEDVEVEGLNRLPKQWQRKRKLVDYDTNYENAVEEIARKRRSVYQDRARKAEAGSQPAQSAQMEDIDGLFVPDVDEHDNDELFENVDIAPYDAEDDLERAIAMSLEQPEAASLSHDLGNIRVADDGAQAPADEFDLQTALAESRQSKYRSKPSHQDQSPPKPRFSGPLPFESLNLGQSLLGKKKAKKVEEDLSGGFDRKLGEDAFRKEKPAQPVPSWFESDPKMTGIGTEQREEEHHSSTPKQPSVEMRSDSEEVVELHDEVGSLGNGVNSHLYHPPTDEAMQVPEEVDDLQDDPTELEQKLRDDEARNARYRIAEQIARDAEDPVVNAIDVSRKAIATETIQQQILQPLTDHGPVDDYIDTPKPSEPAGSSQMEEQQIDWSESDGDQEESLQDEVMPSSDAPPYAVPDADEDLEVFEDVPIEQPSPDEPLFFEESAVENRQPQIPHEAPGIPTELPPPQDDYFSDSDEELMRQLAIEAEEHARFASSLTTKTPAEAAQDYENELKQLRNQQKKDRRDADEVTQVMVQECQALLRLFGLPYITAPMEAEAQCAELVHLGLVDGIVTDDSDIFLFGGTRVYKNMFNAAKFVECYLVSDLEREYALDRHKLIRFAHLLGSDYTEGIPGIGPVTALEILTDFSTLQEFKEWSLKLQLGRLKDLEDQLTTPFRRKFRNTVQKRLFLPPGFPDVRVDRAYLNPDVDSDPEEFQWGVPDLGKLRSFLMATIGWSQDRTDEILVPVIRDMNKRDQEGTQANITKFFAGGVGIGATSEANAPRNRTGKESGRMANAYKRLRGEAQRKKYDDVADVEDGDDEDLHGSNVEKRKKPTKSRKKRAKND